MSLPCAQLDEPCRDVVGHVGHVGATGNRPLGLDRTEVDDHGAGRQGRHLGRGCVVVLVLVVLSFQAMLLLFLTVLMFVLVFLFPVLGIVALILATVVSIFGVLVISSIICS